MGQIITVRIQTGIVEKCYMSIIECCDRPAAADKMVRDILPFEKSPIFPVGVVIQHDQTWSDRLGGLLLSQ